MNSFKKIFIILMILIFSIHISCVENEQDLRPTQQIINSEDFQILEGPPPLPFIFNGKFTIDNKPGPAGITIFAQIIDGGSPIAVTENGSYRHIILSPVSQKDLEHGIIHFYLGDREGNYVESDQIFKLKKINNPTTINLDLNFSNIPTK
ncbi:MAG: hypothetical protein CL778_00655 [Chloroflexi bacterium]|nr:hypothetical protein [Chloroflexota bacterium]|tara:strand:- start:264 stop:713 length:450 start_codon:yes stop_codon:yes gene_type:complete